jgi:hypothetical protein
MDDSKEPEPGKGPDTLTPREESPAVPSEGVPTYADWRPLAQQIQQETDPQKLFALVRQLMAMFDDEELRDCLRRPPEAK